MRTSSEGKMASNRRSSPRGSPFALGTHLLLTLITLYLFFEILRLPTSTSAVPINHLACRRDDSGTNDAPTYHAATDSSVGPMDHLERDVGEDIKTTFKDIGIKIKNVFVPEGDKKTTINFVAEYADDELDHHIPIKELKESFKKNYGEMKHSDNKMSDEDWAHDQIKNVVPGLRKVYDEANKTDSASNHHQRDTGDKPRPKQGDADYYTDPSFFPYPMPPTPDIADVLKNQLGDAFNK